jgi:hypothetical protein
VGDARWEVPEIALGDVVDEGASGLIHRRDAGAAGDHVRPFGLLVPVHLANSAWFEAHVHAGELGRGPELAAGDLARPSS